MKLDTENNNMTTANVSLTPLRDLYVMASRSNGSQIECLNLDALTEADIDAETAHYEKTRDARMSMVKADGRPADVYGSLRGAKSGGLVRGVDGVAVTMFGSNLERQANAAGGIASLLKNWGGGKRAGSAVVRSTTATAVRAESKPLDIDSELKAIRDREQQLLALVAEREEAARVAADEALTALAAKVAKFVKLDIETLKEVLTEAGATDLESGMEAAMAYSA